MYKGAYPFYPWFGNSENEGGLATLQQVLERKGEDIWNENDRFYDDWANDAVYLKHGEGEYGTHERYSGEHVVNPVVAMYEGIDSFNNGEKSTKSLKNFEGRVKYLKNSSVYDASGAKSYDTLNYKDWPI
jgi:DNA-directed RNA polymerase delta subunit